MGANCLGQRLRPTKVLSGLSPYEMLGGLGWSMIKKSFGRDF